MKQIIFSLCFFATIVGFTFIFTNHPYAEENIIPSEKDTVKILEELKDKTYDKYTIGTYSISSNNINIEIVGDHEYYYSIKNEVEKLVKNTIKSTPFEKYAININQSKINLIDEEKLKEKNALMKELFIPIKDYLSESYPNEFDRLNVGSSHTSEISIRIRTYLDGKPESIEISKEMKDNIDTILEKNLSSNNLLKEKPVKIYIYNKNGEIIKMK